MNPDLQDPIGLPILFEDNETIYEGRDIERVHGVTNAQIPLAVAGQGLGVRKDAGGEMLVTAGTGLSVNIATGTAVVGAGTDAALGCGIQLANSITKSGLEANRNAGNPLYLFAAFYAGNGTTVLDSFETRQGYFPVANTPTVAGWVLLATLVTTASTVTVTPNPLRFTKSGLPATTATNGIGRISVAPVDPANPVFVGTNDPRNSDARTPIGAAGGVLSGTYPNPVFAVDMATQAELDTAIATRAPLASPALTGTPTAPTATPGTNTTQVATTAFVLANGGGGGGGGGTTLAILDTSGAPVPATGNATSLQLKGLGVSNSGTAVMVEAVRSYASQMAADADDFDGFKAVPAPAATPQFVQITIDGEETSTYVMNGTEDRVDSDSSNSPVTVTLPLDFASLYKMPRATITNIGDGGFDTQVYCNTGTTFPDGTNLRTLASGDSLEVYVAMRANGSYVWATI